MREREGGKHIGNVVKLMGFLKEHKGTAYSYEELAEATGISVGAVRSIVRQQKKEVDRRVIFDRERGESLCFVRIRRKN